MAISYKPLILHYITKWYVCVRIVLTFLKGYVLSDAHFVENAFDKKTNNDFDINGIPEENDSMKKKSIFRFYIYKKKKSLYTRL